MAAEINRLSKAEAFNQSLESVHCQQTTEKKYPYYTINHNKKKQKSSLLVRVELLHCLLLLSVSGRDRDP